jgi:hypothetical protein
MVFPAVRRRTGAYSYPAGLNVFHFRRRGMRFQVLCLTGRCRSGRRPAQLVRNQQTIDNRHTPIGRTLPRIGLVDERISNQHFRDTPKDFGMQAGIRTRDLRKIYTSPPPLAASVGFGFSPMRGKKNKQPKPEIIALDGLFA